MDVREVFLACITHLPFHPVLWQLYYVCSSLYACIPRNIEKSRKVCMLQIEDFENFFVNNPERCSNGFWIRDETITYLKYGECFYQIPTAWISRLYHRNNEFYLYEKRFCCRLNYMKKHDCVMYKRALILTVLNCMKVFFILVLVQVTTTDIFLTCMTIVKSILVGIAFLDFVLNIM